MLAPCPPHFPNCGPGGPCTLLAPDCPITLPPALMLTSWNNWLPVFITVASRMTVMLPWLLPLSQPTSTHRSAGSADDDTSPDMSTQDDTAEPTPSGRDDTLLAHLTKGKPLPAGNLKHLLSPSSNSKPTDPSPTHDAKEVLIGGTKYHQVNIMTRTLYSVSSSKATHPWEP